MPRKWSNTSSGGGGRHIWVPPTPFRLPLDLKIVDEILAANARIASREKNAKLREKRNRR